MKNHKISWLNIPGYIPETWNPIIGCSKISDGCENCYAETQANIRSFNSKTPQYKEVVSGKRWNGKTTLVKSQLDKPSKWTKPRAIFVCSMGDLFHESVPFEWIDDLFAMMASNPQHLFIVLTKRPHIALKWFNHKDTSWKNEGMQGDERIRYLCYHNHGVQIEFEAWKWPLPNVWMITTTENQEELNKRAPYLLQVPAAKRGISIEPMLGPMDIQKWLVPGADGTPEEMERYHDFIDWVIVGGETGPKARPMHPDWVRSVRDQCHATGTPFFFKQWGEYRQSTEIDKAPLRNWVWVSSSGDIEDSSPKPFKNEHLHHELMIKVGRKAAGDWIDFKRHHNWPI